MAILDYAQLSKVILCDHTQLFASALDLDDCSFLILGAEGRIRVPDRAHRTICQDSHAQNGDCVVLSSTALCAIATIDSGLVCGAGGRPSPSWLLNPSAGWLVRAVLRCGGLQERF